MKSLCFERTDKIDSPSKKKKHQEKKKEYSNKQHWKLKRAHNQEIKKYD